MKKKISEKANLKSDKAFFNKDKQIFGKTAKRAYIALLILAGVVSVSAYMRNRAEIAETTKTAFDENVWQEAIEESGLDEPALPVSSETLPQETQENNAADKPAKDSDTVPEVTADTAYSSETNSPVQAAIPEVVAVSAEEDMSGFIRPAKGKITNEFSGDELVYQSSTDDWRTHNGIDFAATEGEQVLAAADGTVKKVEKDEMWGIVVEIEHSDGIVSRYLGLQSIDFIQPGKSVKKGDIIGGVGKSGTLEADGGVHLHFEVVKNGEYENPNFYFVK